VELGKGGDELARLLPKEGRLGNVICRRRINGALAHKTAYRCVERQFCQISPRSRLHARAR
jgi:hypothetical protein